MERIRQLFSNQKGKVAADGQEYARLNDGLGGVDGEDSSYREGESSDETPFSWVEYLVFALLGVAMLWAWCVPGRLRARERGRTPVYC